jgi:quinol-cytochrome oxidoreductase complex cytochrome b subunit
MIIVLAIVVFILLIEGLKMIDRWTVKHNQHNNIYLVLGVLAVLYIIILVILGLN